MTQRVWFVRIINGVWHTFPDRKIEWIMGLWAFLWSARWLFDPADNFGPPDGLWESLRVLFGADWFFAGMMFICATARLAALTINGTFRDTIYARYSPLVRGITASFCGLFWFAIWMSMTASHLEADMPLAALAGAAIEFLTAWFVIAEAADVLRDWRHDNDRER